MDKEFRSGFVAVVGRSNVGKSTILNSILDEKVLIVSDKPQTTRNKIQCVLTKENYQIIFIDTPGIHKARNVLGERMVNSALDSLKEVDLILLVLDIYSGIGPGDRRIINILKDIKTPIIVLLNKIDLLDDETLKIRTDAFLSEFDFDNIIPVSGLKNFNLNNLEATIYNYLEKGPKYYPDDMVTDQPERVIISEFIREKALFFLEEEIPHGVGVEIMSIKKREDQDLIDIEATIFVEKKSHKGIVIGKKGSMLRKIGENARKDIEKLLGTRIFLNIWVKISEDWRNKRNVLKDLGYYE